MSAFVVDKKTVDLIVAAAAQLASAELDNKMTLTEIGQHLLDECVRSVRYRYPDDELGDLPGSYDQVAIADGAAPISVAQWLTPYEYRPPLERIFREDLEEALSSYSYQSCEHPDWGESWAHKVTDGLRQCLEHFPARPVVEPIRATRSLSCKETAKLVRQALKERFPGVKFSVRSDSYAGGASISVNWTDGPTSSMVDEVLNIYEGAGFDSMTDMKTYNEPTLMALPDGNVEALSFGADYVQGSRRISDARRRYYKRELERFIGHKLSGDSERVEASVCRRTYEDDEHPEWNVYEGSLSRDEHGVNYATQVIDQIAHSREWRGERCPGGEGVYCPGCHRWQGEHRGEHLR